MTTFRHHVSGTNSHMAQKKPHYISDPESLKVLASPVRKEIVDYIEANGPSSIAELSVQLRHSPTALYYHVDMLVKAKLMLNCGVQKGKRRSEEVFDVVGALRVKYRPNDKKNVEACKKLTDAMLRVTSKDYKEGLHPDLAVVEGKYRNIRSMRIQAWLTKSELAEVNLHIEKITEIFKTGKRGDRKQLCSLTMVSSSKNPEKRKSTS